MTIINSFSFVWSILFSDIYKAKAKTIIRIASHLINLFPFFFLTSSRKSAFFHHSIPQARWRNRNGGKTTEIIFRVIAYSRRDRVIMTTIYYSFNKSTQRLLQLDLMRVVCYFMNAFSQEQTAQLDQTWASPVFSLYIYFVPFLAPSIRVVPKINQ